MGQTDPKKTACRCPLPFRIKHWTQAALSVLKNDAETLSENRSPLVGLSNSKLGSHHAKGQLIKLVRSQLKLEGTNHYS